MKNNNKQTNKKVKTIKNRFTSDNRQNDAPFQKLQYHSKLNAFISERHKVICTDGSCQDT